ncbi:uncharacterized protein [Dermacentor andersoni]|uniref:uncharacterized protein isoform X1 n=1 Tax=Dermacentor andersoni TaxID=34620 RepID=UPI003B3AE204
MTDSAPAPQARESLSDVPSEAKFCLVLQKTRGAVVLNLASQVRRWTLLPWTSRQCLYLSCRQCWQTWYMASVGDLRGAGGPVSSVCRSLDIAESVSALRCAPSVLLVATTEEQEGVRPAHQPACATSRDVVGVARLRTQ